MPLTILCLDTSGPAAGVAIVKDGRLCYEATVLHALTHSQSIMPMAQEALGRCGLALSQVDLLACVNGPGSFTGVRIGVAALKGLARGLGKPCIGVNALEAMACAAAQQQDVLVCPLRDARLGQVYAAAFCGAARVLPDMAVDLADFLLQAQAQAQGKPLYLCGDGLPAHQARAQQLLPGQTLFAPVQAALHTAGAAALLAQRDAAQAVDSAGLLPVYLRAPQAQQLKQRAEAANGRG